MPEWMIIVFGTVASLAPVISAGLVARHYRKMGGGVAQVKLNVTLKELNEAYEDRIATLEEDFSQCKGRLMRMEERETHWMEERIELKRELAAVYSKLGMVRREEDPHA